MQQTKPIPLEISKTDLKKVIFELERASELYKEMYTLRASNRLYMINKLLTKLKPKIT